MNDRVPVFRTLTVELDYVVNTDQFYQFATNVADWFDNLVPINVFVDSDTGTLVVEQTIV